MGRAWARQSARDARRNRLGAKVAASAGAALGATVVFAPAAHADTFEVDTLEDSIDVDNCDPGSDCTLREATYEANDNAGYDLITFASGLTGTITLDASYGQMFLEDEVTVAGPGASILAVSGDGTSRVFYARPFVSGDEGDPVMVSGLTLTEGLDNFGGALYA